MRKLLLIPSLFWGILHAQSLTPEVISAAGDYVVNGDYSFSSTVAEMTMVATFSNDKAIFTQGFQQSEITDSSEMQNGYISLYPNPATDWFGLHYAFPHSGELEMKIYTDNGKLISYHEAINYTASNEETFEVRGITWSAGVYVVQAVFTASDGTTYKYPFIQKLVVLH